tara:strand:+ start:45854 stop:46180 length:327 start_codon:yes stop_codon:yes gene_type:complete
MIAVRIFEITFPIFAIVAAGLFYAKKYRPDMVLPNRMNMDIFIPCLLFSVLIERGGISGLFGGLALAITLVILLYRGDCCRAPLSSFDTGRCRERFYDAWARLFCLCL